MKINQAQIRVIRTMLRGKAQDACTLAATTAQANHIANQKLIDDACAKVLKKYEKRLVKGLRPNIDNMTRGYSAPCCIEFNEDVVEQLRAEVKAVVDALPVKGSSRTVGVQIASLNMVDNYSRRSSCDTSMLEVPFTEIEKWRELARDIDSSFMDGDAKKLVFIISNFK